MWRIFIEKLNGWSKQHFGYFGIVAALVLFTSWAVTNILSDKLEHAKDTLQRLQSDQFVHQSLENVSLKTSNIEKTLRRFEQGSGGFYKDVPPLSLKLQQLTTQADQLSWWDIWNQDNYDTLLFARRVNSLLEVVGAESNLQRENASIISELLQFNQIRDKHRNEFGMDTFGFTSSTTDTEADNLRERLSGYLAALNRDIKQDRTFQLRNLLEDEYGYILHKAKERVRFEEALSAASKAFALALYIFGSLLAVYGKWLEMGKVKNDELEMADAS